MKDKEGITITDAFRNILDESNRKSNKMQMNKGSKLYIRSMKSLFHGYDIEMYTTDNEAKSVVTERFIRTLKNKIYKCMISIFKNVYIDKLTDIVNEYNNTYHTTIKKKPTNVNFDTYISFGVENNNKDLKFKFNDQMRTSKYRNIFAKGFILNWSEEVFLIKKVKNTVPQVYVIEDLNGEEIVRTFYEKELHKTNHLELKS